MPIPDESILTQNLIAFLGGDHRAGVAVYRGARATIISVARRRAPDLGNDLEDIANEVFVLMLEAPQRFDSARGSASAFISTILVPEAIQRMRAKMARPGATTRHRRREQVQSIDGLSVLPDPLPHPETIPSTGYGSPQAMEAACDANLILERATPPMKLILGGLMEGMKQGDIAAAVGMDRFRVIRMIASLQRQFAAAA